MPSFLSAVGDRLRFLVPQRFRPTHPTVAVVRLSGAIGAVMPLRTGLSLAGTAPALERAFAVPRLKAVALIVNSPGGSAAQSHLIFERIRALAQEKNTPVFAFVEDVAASGGYMLACAADEIFADPSSLVGSIGVVSAGFGFERLIERFGIERRIHTAGRNKAMLDPFRPEQPEDIARLKQIHARVHGAFTDLVRSRRGERLTGDAETLFSGLVWSGGEALDLGLIDGLGDARALMRARFGDKVVLKLVPMARPGLLARLLGREPVPQVTGHHDLTGLLDPSATLAALEERALWARYGL
jgi:signal peptide peptidase SppA